MDSVTFHAFVDEVARLYKTAAYDPVLGAHFIEDIAHAAPAAESFVGKHIMPLSGALMGGAGGAALGGGEAYLHNRSAAPEDKHNIALQAALGGALGTGVGAAAGHLGSVGLDQGKTYATGALHDLGKATTEGATKGMTEQLAKDVPDLVGESVRRGAHEIGAAPAEAARGLFSRIMRPKG